MPALYGVTESPWHGPPLIDPEEQAVSVMVPELFMVAPAWLYSVLPPEDCRMPPALLFMIP
ncbi:MAG: hypothetical protein ACREBI_04280 [Nitrosotalea sp.]